MYLSHLALQGLSLWHYRMYDDFSLTHSLRYLLKFKFFGEIHLLAKQLQEGNFTAITF